jgi:hypothetical protein
LQNVVAKMLVEGRLIVVDYTPDDMKPLSKDELKKYRSFQNSYGGDSLLAPPGYTMVGVSWHRPGSVLFFDADNRRFILMGVDEGSYFAVELPDGNHRTVDDAFLALMPKQIRKIPGVRRQGEWFAVPVQEKDFPKLEECIAFGDDITLPVEHPESNHHRIFSRINSAGVRVGPDMLIYGRSVTVEHDQHATLEIDGHCVFVRNTAVRSFSSEAGGAGVD